MERRTLSTKLTGSTIPLVFVNAKDNDEVYVVPSDYPYRQSKIESNSTNSPELNPFSVEYPILPKLVKTPRRTLVTYSPRISEEMEKPFKTPFEDLFSDRVTEFLDSPQLECDNRSNDTERYISDIFVQEVKRHRRHYVFSIQWKRNAVNMYLAKRFMSSYNNENMEQLKGYIKSKSVDNNVEYGVPSIQNDVNNNHRKMLVKDWRNSNVMYFKRLYNILTKYHRYLYKKQERIIRLKNMADSTSRYFFEILAEAKECERKMYEFELFTEETIYGRRDFITEHNRENQLNNKRMRKFCSAFAAHYRRNNERNRQANCIPTSTPNRANTSNRQYRGPSVDNHAHILSNTIDVGIMKNDEQVCGSNGHMPTEDVVRVIPDNEENVVNSNYTGDFPDQTYNSSRDTTIPCEVRETDDINQAKDTSVTKINLVERDIINNSSSDGPQNSESRTICNISTSANAEAVNVTPSSLYRGGDASERTPRNTDKNVTSQAYSIGSFYDGDSRDYYDDGTVSNRLNSTVGINRWIYSKMEERGEMDGYSGLLQELGILMFSGNNTILGFAQLPQSLGWLDENDPNRSITPPSQDSFRDGTLFTTCCYAEIKLMKILLCVLYTLRSSKTRDKDLLSLMLQQILEANDELYQLKRKLENGRSALLKKIKLNWAERNSKWGVFPPLKRGYRLLNMLGKGGFAEVWEVLDPTTLTIQAAKLHILSHEMSPVERGNVVMRVKNEIDIHKTCRRHKHIVNMKACFEMGDNMLATILELCDEGDLDQYIKLHGPVPEKLALMWTYQILDGLRFMKMLPEGRVHHCDLKPGNILKHRGNIKLADFGLSKIVPHDAVDVCWGGGGTVWYQPPECLSAGIKNKRILLTDKIDMWAVGCILYEMLFNSRPFGSYVNKISPSGSHQTLDLYDTERVYQEAMSGVNFPQTYSVSDECKKFIQSLLSIEPSDRPSIEEALDNPLFFKR